MASIKGKKPHAAENFGKNTKSQKKEGNSKTSPPSSLDDVVSLQKKHLIPKLKPNVLCGFSTSTSKEMRCVLEVLSHLSTVGQVSFSKNQIEFSCRTDKSLAVANISADSCDVEQYRFDENKLGREKITYGLSLQQAFQCISVATQSDYVTMYISKESIIRHEVMIEIHNKGGMYMHSHAIKMMRLEPSQMMELSNIVTKKEFDVSVKMSTSEFLRTLRAANKNGNTLQIMCHNNEHDGNNHVYFATKGKNLGSDFYSRHFFTIHPHQAVNCLSKNLYSIAMMLVVGKATNLSTAVHLYLNEGCDTLGIKYRISTIGMLKVFLVPLTEKGTFDPRTGVFAVEKTDGVVDEKQNQDTLSKVTNADRDIDEKAFDMDNMDLDL